MNRRSLLAAGSALALSGCASIGGEGEDWVTQLRNLVYALAAIIPVLGTLVGLSEAEARRIAEYLRQAEELLVLVIDVASDASRSAAERILILLVKVLAMLEPVAAGSSIQNVIRAALILIPLIALAFGVNIPPIPVDRRYAPMSLHDAELTTWRYAHRFP